MSNQGTWVGLELIISQVEYSFHDSTNRSTRKSPFEIVYGMHPRGILELIDLKRFDRSSAQGEDFSITMKDIHHRVKETLQKNVDKYKERVDEKRRDVQF